MEEREKSKPVVSVIIPVYNLENYLDTCLDSVGRQTYGDFEAIVVDDGSTGGSQAGARFGGGSSAGVKSEAQRPVVVQPTRSTAGMRSVGVRQGESSLVEGAAPVSCGDYAVGDRVSHLKFGAGVIRRIETLASDHKLVVEFSGYGEKTLLAKFAKLTKL